MHDFEDREFEAILAIMILFRPNRLNSSDETKKKKSALQQAVLKRIFNISLYPTYETRFNLGIILGLSPKIISIWFQNQRHIFKEKKYLVAESNEAKTISLKQLFLIYFNVYENNKKI